MDSVGNFLSGLVNKAKNIWETLTYRPTQTTSTTPQTTGGFSSAQYGPVQVTPSGTPVGSAEDRNILSNLTRIYEESNQSSGGGGGGYGGGGAYSYSGGVERAGNNYFDTAKNEGYVDGVLYRDHNEWRRAMESRGYLSGEDAASSFINESIDPLVKLYEEAQNRAKQFDEENPFVFDEVLARGSAEERFNPFYESELRDYLGGVYAQRGRTTQDERILLSDLTEDTTRFNRRTQRQLESALLASEQGYAGTGLFESGERLRASGTQRVETKEDVGEFMLGKQRRERNISLAAERSLEDSLREEATTRRKMTAARETDIRTDIEQQRKEEQQQREFERQQFIGQPYATGLSSTRSIYGV